MSETVFILKNSSSARPKLLRKIKSIEFPNELQGAN